MYRTGAAITPAALTLVVVSEVVGGCAADAYDATRHLSFDPALGAYGTLDVYEPKGDSVRTDRPAIIAIPGGGWRGGDKVGGQQIAAELCPFGYVVFSVNYRLAGRPGGTWPAQIEDVQKALKHIRANARQFRTDPERIASLGMSAGGHLATMLALRAELAGAAGETGDPRFPEPQTVTRRQRVFRADFRHGITTERAGRLRAERRKEANT